VGSLDSAAAQGTSRIAVVAGGEVYRAGPKSKPRDNGEERSRGSIHRVVNEASVVWLPFRSHDCGCPKFLVLSHPNDPHPLAVQSTR
jgi:hypothetical protein